VNLSNPLNHGSVPYALSIAGFDPSAGAGVLADVKTFEANGVYGFGVVTALTWQNDIEFENVEWVTVEKIIEQIAVLLRRFEIRFIKIGLIENIEVLDVLVQFLKTNISEAIIIYDPIIKASAGFTFHMEPTLFHDVLQQVYCITPNIPEAEWLYGKTELNEKLERQSETVNIYLKGGHNDESTATDMLFTADHTYVFANDRLEHGAKHGSGCVLSAALTAQLALGKELPDAAELANLYTHQYLASSDTLLGFHKPLPA
jgi:hydroxymethylpyrimidine/phosphomethylpyrimidine kinase